MSLFNIDITMLQLNRKVVFAAISGKTLKYWGNILFSKAFTLFRKRILEVHLSS